MAPIVSYIIAAYNHERYIGDLIRSIRSQTEDELEIVIIDDGSTDTTVSVAAAAAQTDPRIRIYEQENQGVVAARNRGIGLTSAPYISIVDSDDLLPADRTKRMLDALIAHPKASLVYGDAWIIDEEGKKLGRFFENYPPPSQGDFSVELFSTWCFVPAVSVMFRRSALESSGLFWGPGHNTDYLKWIEMGMKAPAILLDSPPLGSWRWHGSNVSRACGVRRACQYEQTRQGLEELINKHVQFAERIGPKRIRWRYGRCHFVAGFYAARGGEWPEARKQFSKAIIENPSLVNRLAQLSAAPLLCHFAAPLYALAEKCLLKVRA